MFEFQAQARLLQLSPVFEASQLQDDRMAGGPALKDRASMIRPGAIDRCPLRTKASTRAVIYSYVSARRTRAVDQENQKQKGARRAP